MQNCQQTVKVKSLCFRAELAQAAMPPLVAIAAIGGAVAGGLVGGVAGSAASKWFVDEMYAWGA